MLVIMSVRIFILPSYYERFGAVVNEALLQVVIPYALLLRERLV